MAAIGRLEMKTENTGSVQSVKSEGSTDSNSNASCSALKSAYNVCFNRWYTEKFLKGQWEKEECIVEWEAYRACLSVVKLCGSVNRYRKDIYRDQEETFWLPSCMHQKRLEDRNLSHLLKIENLMLASNQKRTKSSGEL